MGTLLRGRCAACGAEIEAHPHPAADEWVWRDSDGRAWVPSALAEALRVSPTFWHDLAEASVVEYSRLSAAYSMQWADLGHEHRPGPRREPLRVEAPECCGWPMRWAPSGWRCRVSTEGASREAAA